jgi:hypothetical protein
MEKKKALNFLVEGFGEFPQSLQKKTGAQLVSASCWILADSL